VIRDEIIRNQEARLLQMFGSRETDATLKCGGWPLFGRPCATIGNLKSASRAGEGSGLLSAPDVGYLISSSPHRRTKSRRYSSRYKVMLNWEAVVGVAQLVERRSVAPNVAGSNPVSHPKILNIV
jgi:hypothetical protein